MSTLFWQSLPANDGKTISFHIGIVECVMRKEPRPFVEISLFPVLCYAFSHTKTLTVCPVIQEQDTDAYLTTQDRVI